MKRARIGCAAAFAWAAACAPPRADARPEPGPPAVTAQDPAREARLSALRREANAALERKDYERARDALIRLIEETPESDAKSPALRYNLACVRARLGQREEAIADLEGAIALGFVDFHHIERDPDLAPLRDTAGYALILAGWTDLLDARARADMESVREALGPQYRYSRVEVLRLNVASCFDERSTREAVAEVEKVAGWAAANLFGADESADDRDAGPRARPAHWVTLILPTPAHFVRFVPAQGVGGIYDFDRRLLVSQELGASLRHEFLHVLHHRRMNRLGQSHAWWVQEGLGSLVEDLAATGEGPEAGFAPAPSWRTNIAKRLGARAALTPWKDLFAMSQERFVGARPIANYSQARAIFLFLSDRGLLRDWMRAYEETFSEDPTGLLAFERCAGKPAKETEREFRAWLAALPSVAEELRPGMPSLGAVVGQGTGEGPVVEEAPARADAPGAERLRRRDIITAVAGEATRTMEDVVRVLAERSVGESVVVSVRRGTRRLEIPVTLRAVEREAP